MSVPEIAVVVPTRFRETRLAFALDALAAQTLSPERYEVVVVRAQDATGGTLTQAPPGLEVRFEVAPVAGAAAQRNVGWRASSAPLVAFTDDDCRPAPDWLERLLDAARGEDVFLQGRTEPDPDERLILHGFARSITVTALNPWAPTCNMAYPRALLERVGGFDEGFAVAWGEDTDLALRAKRTGARQEYLPKALVWHAVHPRSHARALREAARRNTIPIVVARHPEHREALHWGVFVRDTHALAAIALLGLAFMRARPGLALLGFAPWLGLHLSREPMTLRETVRWLAASAPRAFALDVTEMASLAVASIRYRALVL